MRPSESLEAHPSKVTGRPSFVRDGVTLMRALGSRFDTTSTPCEHTDDVKPPLSVTTIVAVKWPGLVYVQVTPVVGGSTVTGRWPLPHVNVCDAIVLAPTAYEPLPSRVALNGGGPCCTGVVKLHVGADTGVIAMPTGWRPTWTGENAFATQAGVPGCRHTTDTEPSAFATVATKPLGQNEVGTGVVATSPAKPIGGDGQTRRAKP